MRDVEFAPLTGSPARLASVAASSARAAAVLEDARGRLSLVCGALAGQGSGAVASGWALLDDVGARLGVCADVLGAASSTLRAHAGELADRQREASLAISRRTEALDRERRLLTEADEAWHSTWRTLGVDVDGANLRALLAESAALDAREEARGAEAQWRRARDAKAASSVSAASRLGGLAEVRALQIAAAAGTSVPAFEASWARGHQAAALVATARPWNGAGVSERADAAAELRRALADAGGDPAFWAAFWSQVAPGDLYLALGVRGADKELAASLGAGVRAWARTAAPAELEAFGRSAIADLGTSELGLEERAALAAVLLAPTLPGLVHRSAADALAERRAVRPDDPVDVARLSSVTTAVATGLALDPRAAFEHLAPGDGRLTAERALVWLGVAPPDGWPDGGEAVAGAFAAAVLVGSRSPSRTDQARAALLVSHATQELPRGLLAGPVPPSDLASRRIARAYWPYVPVLGDTATSPADEHDPRPAGIAAGFQHAEGLDREVVDGAPAVVQPDLDPFALRDVIAATSQTPGAAGAWLGSADRYQDAMLGLAFGAAAPDGMTEDDRAALATETLRDAGAVAGAIQADVVAAAERTQEAQNTVVTAGTFAVSLATTKVPVSPVVVTTATSGVGAVLPGMLPDHVGAARAHVLATEPTLRERYAGRAFEVAVAHDVASGVPLHDAVERNEALAPRSDGAKLAFGGTYDQMSGLGRRLGENP